MKIVRRWSLRKEAYFSRTVHKDDVGNTGNFVRQIWLLP